MSPETLTEAVEKANAAIAADPVAGPAILLDETTPEIPRSHRIIMLSELVKQTYQLKSHAEAMFESLEDENVGKAINHLENAGRFAMKAQVVASNED
jgi:hypothetical protein